MPASPFLFLLAACAWFEAEPDPKPFRFETFETALVRPTVRDADTGEPVEGVLVAIAATDHLGRPVILGRARTLADGEAKIRVVLSPAMSETRVLAKHADYQDVRSFELGTLVRSGAPPIAVPMERR